MSKNVKTTASMISCSKKWPVLEVFTTFDPSQPKTELLGKPNLFLSINARPDTNVAHFKNKNTIFYENNKEIYETKTSNISSIELANDAKYAGISADKLTYLVIRSIGGKKFCELLNVNYNLGTFERRLPLEWLFLSTIICLITYIFSFYMFFWFARLILILSSHLLGADPFAIINIETQSWWEKNDMPLIGWAVYRGISYILPLFLALIPVISLHMWLEKNKPELLCYFSYKPAYHYLIVYMMNDGKRYVVGTTYKNMSLATQMLSDHQNALDAARLDANKPNIEDLDDKFA